MAKKQKRVVTTPALTSSFTTGDFTDRMAEGRLLRKESPRALHADWSPASDRPDPIDLLHAQDATRDQSLVPIRYGRMLASPLAFLRGTATVMAHDLAATPKSGLIVQACGDAHLSNFGGYGSPERSLVFDLNDFDETLPAPWEWDVKRLAASFYVTGRTNGLSDKDSANGARSAVRSYREHMAGFAPMSHLEVWYTRISVAELGKLLTGRGKRLWDLAANRALDRGHMQLLSKMTETVDGVTRIADDPPLIVHASDKLVGDNLPVMAKTYRRSIRPEMSTLLSRYHFVDFAQKVVGVGSVGTRCYVVLMRGNHHGDPLFLQFKEASASVLEPFAGKSKYRNHGQRIVHGQQYTQAVSDIFLGWGTINGVGFYVRQLRDMKASVDVTRLDKQLLGDYATMCGWVLARAHARSGDPARIAGYLGSNEDFDDAIVAFSKRYADQTERDYEALRAAVKNGKVQAEVGR